MKRRLNAFKNRLFADIVSVPPILAPGLLPGLNGLRGVSILMVLMGHLTMNSRYGSTFAGSIGVWIFFVISGFLITTLLLKEKVQTGKISLKQFYIRRFLRIIPVAYLFLITLVILNSALKLQVPSKSFLSAFLFFQNLP